MVTVFDHNCSSPHVFVCCCLAMLHCVCEFFHATVSAGYLARKCIAELIYHFTHTLWIVTYLGVIFGTCSGFYVFSVCFRLSAVLF